MRSRSKIWILLGLVLCSGAVLETARAEDEIDPPDRVARLSFIDGRVSLAASDSDDWGDALLNRPITTGDRIWVDAGGRAEVQIGTSTIHVDQNTGLAFLTLDDDTLLMRLTDGVIAVRVHSLEQNETVRIETPNSTVLLREPGEYRIGTEDAGDRTLVTTRSGEAVVTGADNDQHGYIVGANEQGSFSGGDELGSVMTQAARRSAFETWAYEREARAEQSVAANYVPAGTVGYQDLDSYGTWSNEPEYGNVWQPSASYVFTDWAPYRYGRWIWVTPWGWTWVDDAPWGYAPFHYGRWTYLRQRWCWIPGPRHVRASYAPALVGWVGSPNYGPQFRDVGWFPLGPREIYLPARQSSWRYFQSVNFHNVNAWNSFDTTALSNAYNGRSPNPNYRNRGAPHAVTVIDQESFVSGRPTHGQRVNVDEKDLKQWRGQGRAPAIDPNPNSRFGSRPTQQAPAPHLDRQAIATRHQPVTRQRVLPSLDEETAAPAESQNTAPPTPVTTQPGATRRWSGNNVGAPADPRSRGTATPDHPADSFSHQPSAHEDRAPRSRAAENPRVPAPVATTPDSPQVLHDQTEQHPQRAQRQERQAQQQRERQELQVQQQQQRQDAQDRPTQRQERQARFQTAPPRTTQPQAPQPQAVPTQPSSTQSAPRIQSAPRQAVQQPQNGAAVPNGRAGGNGGRAAQPSEPGQSSPRSRNGNGPGGNGRAEAIGQPY